MALKTTPLGRAVAIGRTGPDRVRVWMRSPGGGAHHLELWPEAEPGAVTHAVFDVHTDQARDGTFAFEYPRDVVGARPLQPLTRYHLRVRTSDANLVGEGRFETAPATAAATPPRFSFGIASCHQPFDEDGSVRPSAVRMLTAARTAWDDAGVKFVLWVGDQLYADLPEGQSLFRHNPDIFEWDAARVRSQWHSRYRAWWGLREWQVLHASFAGYPLLDDHEIVDNFGSLPEHSEQRWTALREGGRAAYVDYQHARIADTDPRSTAAYDHAFDYGSAGIYFLDLRTHRCATRAGQATIYEDGQLDGLVQWLAAHSEASALFIVLSVPVFYIPRWAVKAVAAVPGRFREDAHDRWTHPKFDDARRRLLEAIRRHQMTHPDQQVVLVSGDVHVGYVMRCVPGATGDRAQPPLYQFVSSAITHQMSPMSYALTSQVPRTLFTSGEFGGGSARVQMMGGVLGRMRQPVAALNVGIIDVQLGRGAPQLGFRLIGERGGAPHCLFEARTDDPR